MLERQTYSPSEIGTYSSSREVAYNPFFDMRDHANFRNLSEEEQKKLRTYTRIQLETNLGERLSVRLSTTRHEIVEGRICSQGEKRPFAEVIEAGIEYRRENGNPIDFEREDAELEGFLKIESELLAEDTQVGTMILSVSPPGEEGSSYAHNFYDIFILKKDEKGKYIEARRYLSSLTIEEYEEKLKPLKRFSQAPNAAVFLRDPIKIEGLFESPDEVHGYLHRDNGYLEVEEYKRLMQIVEPFKENYMNTLINYPGNIELLFLSYNALLNQTDFALEVMRKGDKKAMERLIFSSAFHYPTARDIYDLGMQPVRVAGGPCPGVSGGFSVFGNNLTRANSPFNVSEYGGMSDDYGPSEFECPDCHKVNRRPKNQLLSECQHCKSQNVAC